MANKTRESIIGPVVQKTFYIPAEIYAKFEQKAQTLFKKPQEAARDAFLEYAEKE